MKTITVGSVNFFCEDRGSGTPLLLVHGFPLDHAMWTGQIEALATHCRVIAPDLPGFGKSQIDCQCNRPTLTMADLADDLAGLLDGLNIVDPVVLCGLSMGGYVAMEFWRRHGARLRGLILCDTRAAADSSEAAAARRVMAQRVLTAGPAPLVESMLTRLFAESTVQQQPELVESIRNVMLATDSRTIAAALLGMAERSDMTVKLGEIYCPVLVLVGQADVISTPTEMRDIATVLPNAEFVEIPSAGHLAPLENPAAVNRAIAGFVAKLRR